MNTFFQLYTQIYFSLVSERKVLLEAKNIYFSWKKNNYLTAPSSLKPDTPILLKNISLSLHTNEVISILGRTGSGKTSLAQLLAGRIAPNKGSVYLDNAVLDSTSGNARYQKAAIQIMPQVPSLSFNPRLSLWQGIFDAYALYTYRLTQRPPDNSRDDLTYYAKKEIFISQVMDLCETLDIDVSILRRLPREVSGGQLQRCALIRTLLVFPKVLILDEPVSHLDITLRRASLDIIRQVQQRTGLGIIIISHLPEVYEFFKDGDNCVHYRLLEGTLT